MVWDLGCNTGLYSRDGAARRRAICRRFRQRPWRAQSCRATRRSRRPEIPAAADGCLQSEPEPGMAPEGTRRTEFPQQAGRDTGAGARTPYRDRPQRSAADAAGLDGRSRRLRRRRVRAERRSAVQRMLSIRRGHLRSILASRVRERTGETGARSSARKSSPRRGGRSMPTQRARLVRKAFELCCRSPCSRCFPASPFSIFTGSISKAWPSLRACRWYLVLLAVAIVRSLIAKAMFRDRSDRTGIFLIAAVCLMTLSFMN